MFVPEKGGGGSEPNLKIHFFSPIGFSFFFTKKSWEYGSLLSNTLDHFPIAKSFEAFSPPLFLGNKKSENTS